MKWEKHENPETKNECVHVAVKQKGKKPLHIYFSTPSEWLFSQGHCLLSQRLSSPWLWRLLQPWQCSERKQEIEVSFPVFPSLWQTNFKIKLRLSFFPASPTQKGTK